MLKIHLIKVFKYISLTFIFILFYASLVGNISFCTHFTLIILLILRSCTRSFLKICHLLVRYYDVPSTIRLFSRIANPMTASRYSANIRKSQIFCKPNLYVIASYFGFREPISVFIRDNLCNCLNGKFPLTF